MTSLPKRRYIAGEHKLLCDNCGLTFLRSETRRQWDNLQSCERCYDPKHQQLNIRGYTDKQTVDIARPEPENDDDLTFFVPTPDDL